MTEPSHSAVGRGSLTWFLLTTHSSVWLRLCVLKEPERPNNFIELDSADFLKALTFLGLMKPSQTSWLQRECGHDPLQRNRNLPSYWRIIDYTPNQFPLAPPISSILIFRSCRWRPSNGPRTNIEGTRSSHTQIPRENVYCGSSVIGCVRAGDPFHLDLLLLGKRHMSWAVVLMSFKSRIRRTSNT